MIGGSTNSSTNSGASSTVGSPGTSASTTPVSTRRMAGGIFESRRDDGDRGDHGQQQYQNLDRRNHARRCTCRNLGFSCGGNEDVLETEGHWEVIIDVANYR